MYKATTPTFTLTFPEGTSFDNTNVYVTFAKTDREEIFTKQNADLTITDNVIEVFLDQSETLSIPSSCLLQVNWTYEEDGTTKRACSEIVTIGNKPNLKPEVL